ncbi:MAG: HD domain-containing protein [Candidatus Hodarchaeota archaeon]
MIDYIIDPLFGKYSPAELIKKLILTPEFQRLREVRLSNINSMSISGWSNQSRFEHSLGVAYLAKLAAEVLNLDEKESCYLIIAGLLHDIATPPFAHTTEHLFKLFGKYSHEQNSRIIIQGLGDNRDAKFGRFSQFFCGKEIKVHKILKEFRIGGEALDPNIIAEIIQGRSELGKLIKKDIDLDNLDSVYRMAHHIGLAYDKKDPVCIAQSYRLIEGKLAFNKLSLSAVKRWLELRKQLYIELMTNPMDFSAKSMLTFALEIAYKNGHIKELDWNLTDNELVQKLYDIPATKGLITRLRVGDLFTVVGMFWIKHQKTIESVTSREVKEHLIEEIKKTLGDEFYVYWILDEGKLSRKLSLDTFNDELILSNDELESTVMGSQSYSLLLGVLSSSYSKGIEARTKIKKILADRLQCSLMPVEEREIVSLERFF